MATAQLKLGILLRNDDVLNSMKWMIKAAHAGEAQAHSLLTYVSNQNENNDINVAFRVLDLRFSTCNCGKGDYGIILDLFSQVTAAELNWSTM